MSAIAYITLVGGKLTRDSTITVLEDGAQVACCVAPERGHAGDRGDSARILTALVDLGWQVAGREDQLRITPDGEELDVVPLSGASLDVAIEEGWIVR